MTKTPPSTLLHLSSAMNIPQPLYASIDVFYAFLVFLPLLGLVELGIGGLKTELEVVMVEDRVKGLLLGLLINF